MMFIWHLYKYLSSEPVAVTNHGRTMGYYIPVQIDPVAEDFAALKEAAQKMSALLAQNQLTEDEIVAEFRRAREGARSAGSKRNHLSWMQISWFVQCSGHVYLQSLKTCHL